MRFSAPCRGEVLASVPVLDPFVLVVFLFLLVFVGWIEGGRGGIVLSGSGWVGGWMGGWMDGWMDGWMGGWVDGWMDGWMDGWVDGWMDGRLNDGMHRYMHE